MLYEGSTTAQDTHRQQVNSRRKLINHLREALRLYRCLPFGKSIQFAGLIS